jgi:hypothetical protein
MNQAATEANDKIAALTEEVGRLKAQRLLDNEDLARAYDMGRDKERAAVVAWLRVAWGAVNLVSTDIVSAEIERGEHRREEEP